MSQYLQLLLDDYAAPSFCSFSKTYFATPEQLADFFAVIRADDNLTRDFGKVLAAYDRYIAGETSIQHNVAYQQVPFLTPVELLGQAFNMLKDYRWEHRNVWECSYFMKCDAAESNHIWVQCEGQFYRCIRAHFKNLRYQNGNGEYTTPLWAWGFPHLFELSDKEAYNRLYVVERTFTSKEDALEDIAQFANSPDPDFRPVLDDLFADG